jgi:hypothetical protein
VIRSSGSLPQGKVQGISRFSADFRKNRPEKPKDSRLFRENSLPGRTGNFSTHQGIKTPCSVDSRDNSRLMRRLVRRFQRAKKPGSGLPNRRDP